MRSQDSESADYLLSKYEESCEKYECLHVMAKGSRGHPNLNKFSRYEKNYYLDVCKVTIPEVFKNDPTSYILSPTTEGLFGVILQDESGGRSHTVGINRELEIIYDCMETHELKLNNVNPSIYWG